MAATLGAGIEQIAADIEGVTLLQPVQSNEVPDSFGPNSTIFGIGYDRTSRQASLHVGLLADAFASSLDRLFTTR